MINLVLFVKQEPLDLFIKKDFIIMRKIDERKQIKHGS